MTGAEQRPFAFHYPRQESCVTRRPFFFFVVLYNMQAETCPRSTSPASTPKPVPVNDHPNTLHDIPAQPSTPETSHTPSQPPPTPTKPTPVSSTTTPYQLQPLSLMTPPDSSSPKHPHSNSFRSKHEQRRQSSNQATENSIEEDGSTAVIQSLTAKLDYTTSSAHSEDDAESVQSTSTNEEPETDAEEPKTIDNSQNQEIQVSRDEWTGPDPLYNPNNTSNVYINGLPPFYTQEQLTRLAGEFGHVMSCRVFHRFNHIRSGGKEQQGSTYAFVLFDTVKEAKRCIIGLRQYSDLHPSFARTQRIPGNGTTDHSRPTFVDSTRNGLLAPNARERRFRPQRTLNSRGHNQTIDDGNPERQQTSLGKQGELFSILIQGLPASADERAVETLLLPRDAALIHLIPSSTDQSYPGSQAAYICFLSSDATEEIIEKLDGREVTGWKDHEGNTTLQVMTIRRVTNPALSSDGRHNGYPRRPLNIAFASSRVDRATSMDHNHGPYVRSAANPPQQHPPERRFFPSHPAQQPYQHIHTQHAHPTENAYGAYQQGSSTSATPMTSYKPTNAYPLHAPPLLSVAPHPILPHHPYHPQLQMHSAAPFMPHERQNHGIASGTTINTLIRSHESSPQVEPYATYPSNPGHVASTPSPASPATEPIGQMYSPPHIQYGGVMYPRDFSNLTPNQLQQPFPPHHPNSSVHNAHFSHQHHVPLTHLQVGNKSIPMTFSSTSSPSSPPLDSSPRSTGIRGTSTMHTTSKAYPTPPFVPGNQPPRVNESQADRFHQEIGVNTKVGTADHVGVSPAARGHTSSSSLSSVKKGRTTAGIQDTNVGKWKAPRKGKEREEFDGPEDPHNSKLITASP